VSFNRVIEYRTIECIDHRTGTPQIELYTHYFGKLRHRLPSIARETLKERARIISSRDVIFHKFDAVSEPAKSTDDEFIKEMVNATHASAIILSVDIQGATANRGNGIQIYALMHIIAQAIQTLIFSLR